MDASRPPQRLRVIPGVFAVLHEPGRAAVPDDPSWVAVVRAPEGLTVLREVRADEPAPAETWVGFYGEVAHGLDVPGMLAAVLGPLAEAGVPVFVASTYHADLVLVPRERRREAMAALRAAGHLVVGGRRPASRR
jgi:hypothetical protein